MLLPICTDVPLTDYFTGEALANGRPIRRILMVGALAQESRPHLLSSLDEAYLTKALTLLSDEGFAVAGNAEISICNPAYGSNFLTANIAPDYELVGFCNIHPWHSGRNGSLRDEMLAGRQWFAALQKLNPSAVFNARTVGCELATEEIAKTPYALKARMPLFLGHLDVLKHG
jgi:hypothetical protein